MQLNFFRYFQLIIHHPNDYATEDAPFVLLEIGTETYIDIYPTDSRCTKQVEELPLSQRKCITSSDIDNVNYIYRQPACVLNCYKKKVYENCHCHPYHLPMTVENNIRLCTILDVSCIAENYC